MSGVLHLLGSSIAQSSNVSVIHSRALDSRCCFLNTDNSSYLRPKVNNNAETVIVKYFNSFKFMAVEPIINNSLRSIYMWIKPRCLWLVHSMFNQLSHGKHANLNKRENSVQSPLWTDLNGLTVSVGQLLVQNNTAGRQRAQLTYGNRKCFYFTAIFVHSDTLNGPSGLRW